MPEGKNKQPFVIISVESQKGGVGKTTAALHIARLLSKNRYEVLFFDLDLAGTEIKDAIRSPLWRNMHIVSFPCTAKVQADGKTAANSTDNLVVFYEQYLTGNRVPRVIWRSKQSDSRQDDRKTSSKNETIEVKNNEVLLYKETINVINSSVLKSSIANVPHIGPSILFDDTHAEWFLDMIRDFINSTMSSIKDGRPLAVVIDSSPGYCGLRPNIEEWITDLGPVYGKMILVSSADRQDISACMSAITRVANLFSSKLSAAKLFLKKQPAEEIAMALACLSKTGGDFLFKLLQSEHNTKDSLVGCNSHNWYRVESNEKLGPEPYIDKWWNLILCRVPRPSYNNHNLFSFEKLIPSPDNSVDETIYNKCHRNINARIVHYDSKLALQFVDPTILSFGNTSSTEQQHLAVKKSSLQAALHPIFRSADELLLYILSAQKKYLTAIRRAQKVARKTAINFNWFAFSPIWLFLQAALGGFTAETPDSIASFDSQFSAAIKKRFSQLVKLLQETSYKHESCWFYDAYILSLAFQGHIKPTSAIADVIYTNTHFKKLKKMFNCWQTDKQLRPFSSKDEAVWPHDPLLFGQIDNTINGLISSKKRTDPAVHIWEQIKNLCRSYRAVLCFNDDIRFIEVATDAILMSHGNVQKVVIIESLCYHVLVHRNISVEEAIGMILNWNDCDQVDYIAGLRSFEALNELESFSSVLTPILAESNWGLI